MNIVILAPVSNNYINYFDAIKNDINNNYVLYILSKHRDNYPEKLPNNIKIEELLNWNETYIEYSIGKIFKNNIDIIFSYTEEQILFASYLRGKFHVKGQNVKSAVQFRDKLKMIETAKKTGVNVPKFIKVDTVKELLLASEKFDYPFILKPRDGMGSMNAYKITDIHQLMDIARKQDLRNFIAEEYIDQELYHVDGLVLNNKFKYLIPSKYFNNLLKFHESISTGSVQISEDSEIYNKIYNFTEKLLSGFNKPENFLFHLEIFSNGNNIVFLEIGSRLGGGRILQEIESEFNFNPVQRLLLADIGKYKDNGKMIFIHKKRGFILTSPGTGVLKKIPKVLPSNNIYDQYEYGKLGNYYDGAHSSVDSIIGVSIVGNDEDYVRTELTYIDNWLKRNILYD